MKVSLGKSWDGQSQVRNRSNRNPHTHPHTQTTYVASGVFEFTTDGETKIVRPGDGVYMKPGILHGCICLKLVF